MAGQKNPALHTARVSAGRCRRAANLWPSNLPSLGHALIRRQKPRNVPAVAMRENRSAKKDPETKLMPTPAEGQPDATIVATHAPTHSSFAAANRACLKCLPAATPMAPALASLQFAVQVKSIPPAMPAAALMAALSPQIAAPPPIPAVPLLACSSSTAASARSTSARWQTISPATLTKRQKKREVLSQPVIVTAHGIQPHAFYPQSIMR